MTKEMEPQRGAICYCNNGCLGLITSTAPNAYGDWEGIYLDTYGSKKPGMRWMSRHPKVIAECMSDLVERVGGVRSQGEGDE